MYIKPTKIEFEDFLERIRRDQLLDLRDYNKSSLFRQFERFLKNKQTNAQSVIGSLGNFAFFDEIMSGMIVDQTEFFRDPLFWLYLKDELLPKLFSQKEEIRVWFPGGSSGEDLYTFMLVLRDIGKLLRVKVLCTEVHESKFCQIKNGLFDFKRMSLSDKNYSEYKEEPTEIDFLTPMGTRCKIDPGLVDKVEFKRHRLGQDISPGKFDLIICRNVLLSQGPKLMNKSYRVLDESLNVSGYLALGNREKLQSSYYMTKYSLANDKESVYFKKA